MGQEEDKALPQPLIKAIKALYTLDFSAHWPQDPIHPSYSACPLNTPLLDSSRKFDSSPKMDKARTAMDERLAEINKTLLKHDGNLQSLSPDQLNLLRGDCNTINKLFKDLKLTPEQCADLATRAGVDIQQGLFVDNTDGVLTAYRRGPAPDRQWGQRDFSTPPGVTLTREEAFGRAKWKPDGEGTIYNLRDGGPIDCHSEITAQMLPGAVKIAYKSIP